MPTAKRARSEKVPDSDATRANIGLVDGSISDDGSTGASEDDEEEEEAGETKGFSDGKYK